MPADSASVNYGLSAAVTPTGKGVSGTITVGIPRSSADLSDLGLYPVSFEVAVDVASGVAIDLEVATASIEGAAQAQVETVTIVAPAGITSNGNVPVTITGAHVVGSPATVQVPVTTALTTAALIAAAIANDAGVTAALSEYGVGPVGDTIEIDDLTERTNDPTLNIAIGGGLGITAAPTSAATTAGSLLATCFRLPGSTLTRDDFEGATFPALATCHGIIVQRSGGAGTMKVLSGSGGAQTLTLGPGAGGQIWDPQGSILTGLSGGDTLEISTTGGAATALVTYLSAPTA